jgi:hypothetical protein
MAEQGVSVTCEGGLDLVGTTHTLFRTPGVATTLENYESSIHGGYRRINGFAKYGTNTPDTTSANIEGIHSYAKGVVACQGSNIYYSPNGTTWTQVNKDTYITKTGTVSVSAGSPTVTGSGTNFTGQFAVGDDIKINNEIFNVLSITNNTSLTVDGNFVATASSQSIKKNGADATQLASGSAIARISQSDCKFALYEGESQYGELFIVDGNNQPAYLKIDIASGTHTYFFKEVGRSAPEKSKFATIFGERLIVAGDADNPQVVSYSTRLKPEDFTGSSAGTIDVGDKVKTIKPFRNKLIVFCETSIFQISGLDSTPTVSGVTKNIGCVSGNTVQEIGGDLIFLAPDGLRTIAGTARIDDIELSSISRKIMPLFRDEVMPFLSSIRFASMVIREKSQYRLFYFKSGSANNIQGGVIGTFKISSTGAGVYEWSQTKGIPAKVAHSGTSEDGSEVLFHSDESGFVFKHDSGNSFDGSNIVAQYKTPDMDYGDAGIRKTLYYIKTSIRSEGTNDNLKLQTRYDFESSEVTQPEEIALGALQTPAKFGSGATFGTTLFGGTLFPQQKTTLTGSGFTNNFRVRSTGTAFPYTVSGFYVDFIPAGRT